MHSVQKNYLEKKLEVEKNRLVVFCSQPESQKKIMEIAIGILRKNQKFSKQLVTLDLQIKKQTAQINHLYHQLASLKKILPK